MTGMDLHLGLGLVRSPRAWISKTLEWATPPQGTPAAPRPSLQRPHPLPAVRSVAHKHLRNQFSELPFSCLEQGCGRSPLRGGRSHDIQGIGRLAVSAQGSLRSPQGNWSWSQEQGHQLPGCAQTQKKRHQLCPSQQILPRAGESPRICCSRQVQEPGRTLQAEGAAQPKA